MLLLLLLLLKLFHKVTFACDRANAYLCLSKCKHGKEDNYSDYYILAADCESGLLNNIAVFLSAVGENVIVYANTKGAYSQKNPLQSIAMKCLLCRYCISHK